MPEGRLVIGTKRYSSWSMRGWLAVHLAGLDVEEVLIPLAGGGATTALKSATPTGMVPYLEHRGARVWESLAICDYCAEIAPKLWPADRAARAEKAEARSDDESAEDLEHEVRGVHGRTVSSSPLREIRTDTRCSRPTSRWPPSIRSRTTVPS